MLCCIQCQVALAPSALRTHVRKQHGITTLDNALYARAQVRHKITETLPKIEPRMIPSPPLAGLEIVKGTWCGHCGYGSTNNKSLARHQKDVHPEVAHADRLRCEGSMQRFNANCDKSYWAVAESPPRRSGHAGSSPSLHPPSPDSKFAEHAHGVMRSDPYKGHSSDDDRNLSSWNRHSRWHLEVAKLPQKDVLSLVAPHDPKTEPEYTGWMDGATAWVKGREQSIATLPIGIRKALNSETVTME